MQQKSDGQNKSETKLNSSQRVKLSNQPSQDIISMSQGQTPMDCVLSENKEQEQDGNISLKGSQDAINDKFDDPTNHDDKNDIETNCLKKTIKKSRKSGNRAKSPSNHSISAIKGKRKHQRRHSANPGQTRSRYLQYRSNNPFSTDKTYIEIKVEKFSQIPVECQLNIGEV